MSAAIYDAGGRGSRLSEVGRASQKCTTVFGKTRREKTGQASKFARQNHVTWYEFGLGSTVDSGHGFLVLSCRWQDLRSTPFAGLKRE